MCRCYNEGAIFKLKVGARAANPSCALEWLCISTVAWRVAVATFRILRVPALAVSWLAVSVDSSGVELGDGGGVGVIHSIFASGVRHPIKRIIISPKYEKLRLTQERLPCSN